jgi:hypothetical protein
MMMMQSMIPEKVGATKAAEKEAEVASRSTMGQETADFNAQFPGRRAPIGSSIKGEGGTVEVNPKIGVEEARTLGMADAIGNAIGYIYSKQKEDPQRFRQNFSKASMHLLNDEPGMIGPIPTTIGDNQAGILRDYLKDMRDRVLRLRSGAQINEQEMKRMVGILPTWEMAQDESDVGFERINRRLAQFATEMNGIKQRILSGRMYDDHKNVAIYNPNEWQEDLQKTIQIPGDFAMRLDNANPPVPNQIQSGKSPIPGMDAQINADPLDELRKEYLKR